MALKLPFARVGSYIALVAVVFFMLSHALLHRSDALEQCISYAVHPLLHMQCLLTRPVERWYQTLWAHDKLYTDLQKVVQERDELRAALIVTKGVQHFAQETEELRTFKKRYDSEHGRIAHIIHRQCNPSGHFVLIDLGSTHGMREHMVALYKNCIVGKVSQVFPYWSRVTLLTDASCQIAAYCCSTKATGICRGTHDMAYLSLDFVSHLQAVRPGDLVNSSGQGLVFPQGFGLGKVQEVKSDGLYHRIILEPLVDVASLSYCYVVQKGAQ